MAHGAWTRAPNGLGRLTHPALVDHLLVELADPGPVGEEDAEEAAIGDGAGVRDRHPLRPATTPHRAGHAVPHDPRPQLGELVARVATGEQVEDGAQRI